MKFTYKIKLWIHVCYISFREPSQLGIQYYTVIFFTPPHPKGGKDHPVERRHHPTQCNFLMFFSVF